jgi:hypothetical protein
VVRPRYFTLGVIMPSLFTSDFGVFNDKTLGGGLNTTAGPLQLQDYESSDLQNIDFDKFGSILKRNGYTALNTTAVTGTSYADGLWWYEYNNAGTLTRHAILVSYGKVYQMTNVLNGTWNDITGSVTVTASYHCDFENFLNNVYVTNGYDKPFYWTGSGNISNLPALQANSYTFDVTAITTAPAVADTYTNNGVTFTVTEVSLSVATSIGTAITYGGKIVATGVSAPEVSGSLVRATGSGDNPIAFSAAYANADIEKAKYVRLYNNYLFLGNVTVGSTYYPNRIYWSAIKNTSTWPATNWIEVAKDDGQEITGLKVLQDRLVVYKTRSIYNIFFTGDSDIPFILPGGGKSNSSVGCIAPWSIVEVENGHVFLAFDGIYGYDGNNSYKMTDKLTTTLMGYATTNFNKVVATINKKKNYVYFAFPSATTNDTVIVWNYFLNAWSLYKGMAPSAMTTFYQSGLTEIPVFADYKGFVYKMDTGTDDYPLNVKTVISAYYWTNWKSFDDLLSKKGVAQVNIFYQLSLGTLTFGYTYDFQNGIQFSSSFPMLVNPPLWGSVYWGAFTWTGTGGAVIRRDLTGRGRVVRFYIANENFGETFRIDGFGAFVQKDTNI